MQRLEDRIQAALDEGRHADLPALAAEAVTVIRQLREDIREEAKAAQREARDAYLEGREQGHEDRREY